jgi:hypothetical protein
VIFYSCVESPDRAVKQALNGIGPQSVAGFVGMRLVEEIPGFECSVCGEEKVAEIAEDHLVDRRPGSQLVIARADGRLRTALTVGRYNALMRSAISVELQFRSTWLIPVMSAVSCGLRRSLAKAAGSFWMVGGSTKSQERTPFAHSMAVLGRLGEDGCPPGRDRRLGSAGGPWRQSGAGHHRCGGEP